MDLYGYASWAALFGLCVGSFLNVVIYRLPKIMEHQWAQECAQYMQQLEPKAHAEPVLHLWGPRSQCASCHTPLAWYHNIPVLSYLFLRGQCAYCQARISWRYPVVELCTAALFYFCFWHWGSQGEWFAASAWCLFSAAMVALACIDWDTTLLPDDITLPLLWAGLLLAAFPGNPAVSLLMAVWGAAAGYLVLWLVYWAFKLITGKEGMGYGDFKLLAALGAWLGVGALIPILLMASVVGLVVGLGMKFSKTLRPGNYVPFGPFLAIAGLTAMLLGPAAILSVVR